MSTFLNIDRHALFLRFIATCVIAVVKPSEEIPRPQSKANKETDTKRY